MNQSFYNGVSGIKTQQFGIDVWGNNISNTSLNGFKYASPEFKTLFSTALEDQDYNSISSDIGSGSVKQGTALNLKQGVLEITDNTFDLALNGEGWFGIKAPHDETFYTRAGSYHIDKDGNLVNEAGMFLYGTSGENITPFSGPQRVLDNFGTIYKDGSLSQATLYSIKDIEDISRTSPDSQTKIFLPSNLYYPATPTTNIKLKANFDPQNHEDTSGNIIPNKEHFTTSVIASDGEKKILDLDFTKDITIANKNIWNGQIQLLSFYEKYDKNKTYDTTQYKIYENSNKVYKIEDTKVANISFSSDGYLESANIPPVNNDGNSININVGEIGTYEGFESINAPTGIKNIETDGFSDGMLSEYAVDENGKILANFSNGRTIPVAKIGVYHFQNDMGLTNASGVLFKESSNSGKAFFYKNTKDGTDLDTTKVFSKRLEASNVDSATALTELILTQKAFDANAKSITTSDQMIQKAINMKK